MPQTELKSRKQQGLNILEEVVTPQFVFFGDTNIDALLLHDEWKSYPVIIIECTGYDEVLDLNQPPDRSETSQYHRGHIHINDLIPILQQRPETQFILIHSGGATKSETLVTIQKELNQICPNVVISI